MEALAGTLVLVADGQSPEAMQEHPCWNQQHLSIEQVGIAAKSLHWQLVAERTCR